MARGFIGWRRCAVCLLPPPRPPPRGRGRFVGWGLPHRRTAVCYAPDGAPKFVFFTGMTTGHRRYAGKPHPIPPPQGEGAV